MASGDLGLPTSTAGSVQGSRLQEMQRQFLHPANADQKKLKKAAQEFESIFSQQLFDAMDKTVDREDSLMGGGSAEDYWRSMMNEEVSKSMSSAPGGSGLGLAENIYRQMSDQQAAGKPIPSINGLSQQPVAGKSE